MPGFRLVVTFLATAAGSAAGAASCGTPLVIEPDVASADAAMEASAANDGSNGADAGDAAGDELAPPDAGDVNLAPRVDACIAWAPFQATTTTDPAGHTTTACRVCRTAGGAAGYGLDAFLPLDGNGTYTGALWVRAAGADPPHMINVVLRTYDTDPAAPVQSFGSPPVALGTEWLQLSTALVVTKPASHIELYVFSASPVTATECVLVSDATLVRH